MINRFKVWILDGPDAKYILAKDVAVMMHEAAQEIADWGAYASEYFQEKHDLAETVARFTRAAERFSK